MAIRHVFRDLGRLARFKMQNPNVSLSDQHYELVRPSPSYAPWNANQRFRECYEQIKDHTLVDKYRCYELWNLVEQVAPLEGALMEVGVWRGGSGALIAEQAKTHGIQDPVYLCDTFTGVVKAGENDSAYRGGEHADTDRSIVEKLTSQTFDLPNVRILQGMFPEETGVEAEASSFRFCHIDVDVYQSAKDVLNWVWPKLVPGGIVVYDDYAFPSTTGITKHVEEEAQRSDRIFLHNLNGHAIFVKLN